MFNYGLYLIFQAFQPEVPLPDIPVKPRPRPADNKKMSSVPVSQKPEGLKFGRVPSRSGYQQLMKWQIWFTVKLSMSPDYESQDKKLNQEQGLINQGPVA